MDVIRSIDINCDLGEGMNNDADLMPYISSCNIACGGHFGTNETIRTTIRLAKKHKVKVGAHPSYPDKDNFGRKRLNISPSELAESIFTQIFNFLTVCAEEGVIPNHIKLHGALYNVAATDEPTAKTIATTLGILNQSIPVYTPPNSILAQQLSNSISVVSEAFLDRRYQDDGNLVNRKEENALIHSPELAWKQLKQLFFDREVTSVIGTKIPMDAETYCLHGDGENALEIAQFINGKLKEHGINLRKDA
ncbi:MAG: 5-oxoprolinase subunit PxpA [Crocinitomicaceae bacterium]|nr:5-oxoprolinase subunit PxpA [Flavobacteriales bacterium]NQZ36038.1 5-oxoprolinase subunit PxpA [Crocinitomicaceae bacterium]